MNRRSDSPASEDAAARRLQARLRDMEFDLDQHQPGLVHSADGRLFLCAATMFEHRIGTEPYPLMTPLTRFDRLDEKDPPRGIHHANAAALHRLESRFDGFARQSLVSPDTGELTVARAAPCGYQPHPFQVLWVGSRKEWRVMPGGSPKGEIAETWLEPGPARGFIALDIKLQPAWNDVYTGTFEVRDVSRPYFTRELRIDPPRVTWTADGVLGGGGGFTQTLTWTEGTYAFPIAQVAAPGRWNHNQAPFIRQFLRTDLQFLNDEWRGSFPKLFNTLHP